MNPQPRSELNQKNEDYCEFAAKPPPAVLIVTPLKPNHKVEVKVMGRTKSQKSPRVLPDGVLQLKWTMRFRDGVETVWLWQVQGAPPLDKLAPARTPRSSASNRHIPVSAYSVTTSDVLHLESGLEHDLVRKLDRDPNVLRMIAQPFLLSWKTEETVGHFPDLLTQHLDGAVTVWDVRSLEQQDDDFHAKSVVTRRACERVGWRYAVFAGVSTTERMNTLWLHGCRRRPPWAGHFEQQILRMAGCGTSTVGSLLGADDGTGELTSVMWHLVWTGALRIDMAVPWGLHTPVATGSEHCHA